MTKFNGWNSTQKVLFLQKQINNTPYTADQKTFLETTLALTDKSKYNMEVRFAWILTELAKTTENGKTYGIEFAKTIGRMKFVQPIFVGIYKYDSTYALKNWDLLKGTYHKFVQERVQEAFDKIKPSQMMKFLALE